VSGGRLFNGRGRIEFANKCGRDAPDHRAVAADEFSRDSHALRMFFSLALVVLAAGCHSSAPTPPAPTTYPIVWTWNAPSDAVSGEQYNVYCEVNEGAVVLMNSTPINGLSFSAAAIAGDTYTCFARAVVNGVETADSNIAVTLVP
jgi:hypothetical protein